MPLTEQQASRIVEALNKAYNAEIETVANYIASSRNLDGVRAKHIKDSLAADVAEELSHAQLLADRVHTLGGVVRGSMSLKMEQKGLQPPADSTDVLTVIRGVIEAEKSAIAGYEEIISMCGGVDHVTEDLAITLLADEQQHLREFRGFLKEFEK